MISGRVSRIARLPCPSKGLTHTQLQGAMMTTESFPTVLYADPTTRAGRMFESGDVRVTVTNLPTKEHVTVRFKAMMDNRANPTRPHPEDNRNWLRVKLYEGTTHVFVEVPSASGDFPDKIGTFYPRTGTFYPDRNADPYRVIVAAKAARWLNEGAQAAERVGNYTFQEESYCGVCGRTLTDPESIERGIGPECYGRQTGSKHQAKSRFVFQNVEVHKAEVPEDEKQLVEEILAAITDLSDVGQARIRDELNIWAQDKYGRQ